MLSLLRRANHKGPASLYSYCRHYLPASLATSRMLQSINLPELNRCRDQWMQLPDPPPSMRYLDARHYLMIAAYRFFHLQLHCSPPQKILDLGTGPGYFPYVCQAYNHTVLGTDINGVETCDQIVKILGVPRIIWEIRAFEPAPDLGERFDLVTAFMICFNKTDGRLWGVPEWQFFLCDLAQRHMNPDGAAYLAFHRERTGHFICPDVERYLRKCGAEIKNGKVYFRSMRAFQG